MRKKIDYITIFFLFIIYLYAINISYLPNEITLFKGEELKIKTIYGLNTFEIGEVVSTKNVNKTKVEVKLFGLINVKDIDVISIENYEVVPIRKINRFKTIYKWSFNCWYD